MNLELLSISIFLTGKLKYFFKYIFMVSMTSKLMVERNLELETSWTILHFNCCLLEFFSLSLTNPWKKCTYLAASALEVSQMWFSARDFSLKSHSNQYIFFENSNSFDCFSNQNMEAEWRLRVISDKISLWILCKQNWRWRMNRT